MFPFDIPNRFRSILAGDFWSTKATDTDTKVTVSSKGLFYWHSDIFIRLRITVKTGKLHSVSLLEMRLSGNRYVGSNPTISARMPVNTVLYADKAVMQKQSIASVYRDRGRWDFHPVGLLIWCSDSSDKDSSSAVRISRDHQFDDGCGGVDMRYGNINPGVFIRRPGMILWQCVRPEGCWSVLTVRRRTRQSGSILMV